MNAAPALVPSANRGLKSSHVGQGLPVEESVLAIIDFLTFTLPADRVNASAAEWWQKSEAVADLSDLASAEWIVATAFPGSGLVLDPTPRGFRNFYERHFRLLTPSGDQCGFVALGGARQRGTVCVEVTGAGCAHVVAWAHVQAFLDTFGAHITRVDVAHDDYSGRYGLADALAWHAEGRFNTGGRPPAVQVAGWDDGSGKTVYIGKNTGNQQLCVYEKGRQQGARDGDAGASWIRWEGRFGSKYRDIPTSILIEPAAYLLGHYPVLRGWLRCSAMRMRTSAARAAANLVSAVRHAKRQTGALLNLVKKHCPTSEDFVGWVLKNVVRDRFPAWLAKVPHGAETIKLAFN